MIYFTGLIILLITIGIIDCIKQENKEWNNGVCFKCNSGWYKSFDVDSSGAVGYSCTNCNYITWQSWRKRK